MLASSPILPKRNQLVARAAISTTGDCFMHIQRWLAVLVACLHVFSLYYVELQAVTAVLGLIAALSALYE